MPRIHTRVKRKLNITTCRRGTGRNTGRKPGPKTFTTKESATKYATETRKLKEGSFNIVPAKRNKKFKIETV